MFNEIIILNFCELNKNTALYIMKREKLDMLSRKNSFNEEIVDETNFYDIEE